jgi:hypothetical protein
VFNNPTPYRSAMEAHVIMSPMDAAVIKRADNSRNSAKGFCVGMNKWMNE